METKITNTKFHRRSESMEKIRDNFIGKLYFSKYLITEKIGQGSFGVIYKAEYNNNCYAVKFEKRMNSSLLLEKEATILSYLRGPHIPQLKTYGYNDQYNILVMQLLGKDLEKYIKEYTKLSLKTVCQIGVQIITAIENIHNKHIIHRDIKADNFVMGLNKDNDKLFVIDFGLSRKYRSSKTLKHYPLVNKKSLTGTARYASIHAMQGYEQSRRDDLEAISYLLVYLLKGRLPWQGLKVKNEENKMLKILNLKTNLSAKDICNDLPDEFITIVEYCRTLDYTEDPDYNFIKNSLLKVLSDLNETMDYIYDWTTSDDIKNRNNYNKNSTLVSSQAIKYAVNPENNLILNGKKNQAEKNEKSDVKNNNDDFIYIGRQTTLARKQFLENCTKDEKAEANCCLIF